MRTISVQLYDPMKETERRTSMFHIPYLKDIVQRIKERYAMYYKTELPDDNITYKVNKVSRFDFW